MYKSINFVMSIQTYFLDHNPLSGSQEARSRSICKQRKQPSGWLGMRDLSTPYQLAPIPKVAQMEVIHAHTTTWLAHMGTYIATTECG